MFQFTGFPLTVLCIQTEVTRHDSCWVSLFGNPRIKACLAAPRGLSQPATSFFGFQRQGIHRVPFATCRDDARARYGILKGQSDPTRRLGRWPEGHNPVRPRIPARPRKEAELERSRYRNLQSCTVCPRKRHHWVPAGHDCSVERSPRRGQGAK